MSGIEKVDKNFGLKTNTGKSDIRYYSIDESPFSLHGVFKENGRYRRIPEAVARSVSDGVYFLHSHTAGGRVRFATNSSYVTIHVKMNTISKMSHFAFEGSCGFDMYVDNEYLRSFVPPMDVSDAGYESVAEIGGHEMHEITIHMPLYSGVSEMYVGIEETAVLKEATPYKVEKPIVYYGSSITQGGCASRPGSSYQATITRRFHYDHINLGFSGSAKAEDAMIEYIKNLDMSLFVLDYDHNAPSVDHLAATHEKLFLAVREQHPDLPIIMMPRPKHYLNADEEKRRAIVKTTYENAVARGDQNVYYIDNRELTALCGPDGTVDNCHPTDYGFASMARAVGDVIANIEIK